MLFRFDDCELDPARFVLRKAGVDVHVERQVFEVLVHLVANRDRVVSKGELLDSVWGDRFVSESALTSRIKDARRAVGDDGREQRVIVTVHGVGYRFVAEVGSLGDAKTSRRPRAVQQIRYGVAPDGVRLAYALSGDGPPLVKAANWLTHLDLEWSSPIWSHWIAGLSRHHRLVRYDERGCGLSDRDVGFFTFDDFVDDLEVVVDAVGLDRFPLLGLSQGGPVAIAYAVRHPERVSKLVLAGAYNRGRFIRASTAEEKSEAELDLLVGEVAWRRDDAAYRQVFASQFLPDGTKELWGAFNDLQRDTTTTDNVVRFLEVFANIDVSALAPLVRCPTLIVHSRGDARVPVAQARELAALIPDSRLELLESRNHILTATEPAWPVFLEEVGEFLAA